LLYYPIKGADVNHDSQIFYILYCIQRKVELPYYINFYKTYFFGEYRHLEEYI
jgi:hypothetical protein